MPPDATRSAEEVAAEAFRAVSEGRWAELVSLLCPADVERFAADRVEAWSEPDASPAITVEWLRSVQPEMPEEVAEYQVEQMRKHHHRSLARLSAELGVASAAELAALSPTEVLTRYFQSSNPAAHFHSALAESGDVVPAGLSLDEALRPRYEILGAVAEGDSLAHVVYRVRVGAEEDAEAGPFVLPFVKVATVRRTPDGWRLRLSHDLLNFEGISIGYDPEGEGGEE